MEAHGGARVRAKVKAKGKDGVACRQENVRREGWRRRWLLSQGSEGRRGRGSSDGTSGKWVALMAAGGVEGQALRVKDKGSKNEECKGMG